MEKLNYQISSNIMDAEKRLIIDYLEERHLQVTTIDVDLAEKILLLNNKNRPLSRIRVKKLAVAMNKGQWKYNGEAIKISKTGRLLDGQHRLSAVLETNVVIQALIITGLEEEVFKTIDQHGKRSAGDVLSTMGFNHYKLLGSTLRHVIYYKNGKVLGTYANVDVSNNVIATMAEYYGVEYCNEIMREAFHYYSKFKILRSYEVGFLYFFISQIDNIKCKEFCIKLFYGQNLGVNDPVNLLRLRFQQELTSKTKLPSTERMALIIKTWNYFYENNEVKMLKHDNRHEPPRFIGEHELDIPVF